MQHRLICREQPLRPQSRNVTIALYFQREGIAWLRHDIPVQDNHVGPLELVVFSTPNIGQDHGLYAQ